MIQGSHAFINEIASYWIGVYEGFVPDKYRSDETRTEFRAVEDFVVYTLNILRALFARVNYRSQTLEELLNDV
ncbi:hypothetical protein IQ782_23245 [Salipiger pacificus]|uniref:Type ISP restriction-modification enzyme LLaBIII C-terminal specificity domain-containing protein n=1 Tax=Salipiger mangrovisoli TaxID=2865933 RepID=A0ABR9X8M2_9RHOB|nr:hypothetical protein [Salipiger mangrovisoli]